jgi:hypothetical protein
LTTTKNKRPLREMQALRSQNHQRRKIRKNLKAMPIFSKAPSTMKASTEKEMMTNINLILPTRMSSEELFHQEDLSQTGTKIAFLVIVFLAINLVIKKQIVKYYGGSDHVRDINKGSHKTTKNDYMSNKTRSSHGFVDRNYNSFAPLFDYNDECYKCNNYGNIACDYRSSIINQE